MMLIELHSRKYKNLFVKEDDTDFNRVNQHRWYPAWDLKTKSFYAVGSSKGVDKVRLARFIEEVEDPDLEVDHKNHDTLDDRRSNHRLVSRLQNRMNLRHHKDGKHKFKGVSFHTPSGRWHARVGLKGASYSLKYFDSEVEAAQAYDRKALELFGEFALTDFPRESYASV